MRSAPLLVALTACTFAIALADTPRPGPNPKPGPGTDSPGVRFERDAMVRFHMHQNFDLVRAIERLLIRGNLEEPKRFAAAIGMAPDEPAHGPWAAQAAVVRDRALALARATTIEDALRKNTELAAACGACHREHYGSAMFETPPAIPPDKPTIDARMARHRWAADRLWEALVGDVDGAWREGLDVLAATPLELDAERARYAKQLQKRARIARDSAKTVAKRASLYGDILVVCAQCHAASRK